jgi:hypothetical protein
VGKLVKICSFQRSKREGFSCPRTSSTYTQIKTKMRNPSEKLKEFYQCVVCQEIPLDLQECTECGEIVCKICSVKI